MNLNEHVKRLQDDLAVAADAGGEEARELAERLMAPLDAATRLVLLDALSMAVDEITRELAPGNVELRLRGGEPEFVVTLPPSEEDYREVGGVLETETTVSEESSTARLNLRLPQSLKERIEEAATAEGLSLNAWLVRAATTALSPRHISGRPPVGGEQFTGWVS